ncbi:MAG: nucleoside-diphosphate sugar epimerase, partial [Candidatus Promineifilaceae bacterium]
IWEAGARKAGLSDFAVETLVQMFLHYEQFDFWGNPNVLSWLLGRPPATFAQFLQRVIQDRRQD